ncbi:MAG: hypothetical protein RLZZ488_1151 [Pseudomonadota bacterium]|jgi:hypothetical protein
MMIRMRAWQVHATLMFFLGIAVVYLQAYGLARARTPWLQIDLATIFVVYVSIEHLLLGALVRIFCVAALMHMFSGAPDGFYLMYYLLALVVANLFSRVIALHKLSSQILVFSVIFVLKFVLIYGSLVKAQRISGMLPFILSVAPSLIVTTLLSVPLFSLLARIDGLFDASARRDHRQELVES